MNTTILIITGTPSSGISVLENSLRFLGVTSLDKSKESDVIDVRFIHNLLLQDLGCSCLNTDPLPNGWLDFPCSKSARDRIMTLLSKVLKFSGIFSTFDPFFYLFVPLWIELFTKLEIDYKFILLVRHPWEISQTIVKAMRIDSSLSHLLWLNHTRQTLRAIGKKDKTIISYDQFVADPISTLDYIGQNLKLTWPIDPITVSQSILNHVQPGFKTNHVSYSPDKFRNKFGIYGTIYQELISRNFSMLTNFLFPSDLNEAEIGAQILSHKSPSASDLFDSIFEVLSKNQKSFPVFNDSKKLLNKEKSEIFTQIVFPSYSGEDEYVQTFPLFPDQWQLISLPIPDTIGEVIKLLPLNTNGTVIISSIEIKQSQSTTEHIIWSIKTARQFDLLSLNGPVVRLANTDNCTLIITGTDPIAFISLPKEVMTNVPLNFEMWIKVSKKQELINENDTLNFIKHRSLYDNDRKYPIIITTHHKAGTTFLVKTFRHIEKVLNYKLWYKFYAPDHIQNDWSICIHQHSRVNDLIRDINFRGWHCVRHPKSLIYSAVQYHQKCNEAWAHIPLNDFSSYTYWVCTEGRFHNKLKDPDYPEAEKVLLLNSKLSETHPSTITLFPSSYDFHGKTYQEYLKSLPSIEEKILFEMRSYSRGVINDMLNFPNDKRFFTIKLEDISKNPSMNELREGFLHLGFETQELEQCLKIAEKYCLWNNEISDISHATSGMSDEWKDVFKGKVEDEFIRLFGHAEEALGYFEASSKHNNNKNNKNNKEWTTPISPRLNEWNKYFDGVKFPIKLVAIETKAQCTRNCSYCPVSKSDQRKGELSLENIVSIFQQLSELNYKEEMRLHYYNEPLLDHRLIQIIILLREYLPTNFLRLTTNGDLLSQSLIHELLDAGVSQIKLSIHDPKAHERLNSILSGISNQAVKDRIMAIIFYKPFNAVNRGGLITENDINPEIINIVPGANATGCNRLEFNIDYLGNVYPCCHSFDGTYLLGNVQESKLLEIYEKNMGNFKDHYVGRYNYSVCRKCSNTFII